MGEAKRRKAAGNYPDRTQHPDIIIKVLSEADKHLIARIVRSVTVETYDSDGHTPGGGCPFRCLCGFFGLRSIGVLDVGFGLGGMLSRAGPDPVRDVVGYADMNGGGRIMPDGTLLGHVWLGWADQIIDFSAGDWRAETDRMFATGSFYGDEHRPIEWRASPPDYIWGAADDFRPIRGEPGSIFAPPIGQAWYSGWPKDGGDAKALIHKVIADVRDDPVKIQALRHVTKQMRAAFSVGDTLLTALDLVENRGEGLPR